MITKNITVESVNGPDATFIVGQGPNGSMVVRGVYMSAGVLSGFTVTSGHTRTSGSTDYDRSGGGVNLYGGSGVVSNMVGNPLLVSASHISTNSPCRGAGYTDYASGLDIDGEVWLNPPSIGCDECNGAGMVTGTVSAVLAGPLIIVEGWVASYALLFDGPVTRTMVDFGNGLILTNQFIDTVHGNEDSGFYKLKVDLRD